MTMYYTGLCPGDLNGLCWEHIDVDNGMITKVIEKTAHKSPEFTQLPLSQEATNVINAWHTQQGQPESGYVFPSADGNRLHKDTMRKVWDGICKLGASIARSTFTPFDIIFRASLLLEVAT